MKRHIIVLLVMASMMLALAGCGVNGVKTADECRYRSLKEKPVDQPAQTNQDNSSESDPIQEVVGWALEKGIDVVITIIELLFKSTSWLLTRSRS